jgi:hypothetical protein
MTAALWTDGGAGLRAGERKSTTGFGSTGALAAMGIAGMESLGLAVAPGKRIGSGGGSFGTVGGAGVCSGIELRKSAASFASTGALAAMNVAGAGAGSKFLGLAAPAGERVDSGDGSLRTDGGAGVCAGELSESAASFVNTRALAAMGVAGVGAASLGLDSAACRGE